jgi:hypothetical protein
MKDKMGLSKIQLFPKNAMRKIGALHNTIFKKRVEGGLDGKGKKFKGYTSKYAKIKSRGFVSEITGKKYKYPRAPVASTKTSTPDLTLTGHMLRNLKPGKYSKTEWSLQFTGEHAEKVQGLADGGRDIINDLPNKEKDQLLKLLAKEVDVQFRKLKNVNITVGK